ncbi:DUF1120 domain-containing protein [Burkholderia contaminans]|uniref:DUF1120 domain-containing protein n=1 Tax=Burkholderia contaminans TaxID=488447 RepID=UPI002415CC11|nr:DUF1120 domain-containing protein [Burkholderia contaminans]WFN14780.1 DUF1120 domain-containing protein [Burkholderia contaminans]
MSLKQLCVLFVLACTSSIPGVTSAADLSVGGHIRMDGACSITLGNGGIFDFGNVSLAEIDQDRYSNFRDVPLTINCPSQTRIGVKAIDNRKGSAAASRGFGVGNPAIGGYGFDVERYIGEADGRKVYVIHRGGGDGDFWYRTDDPTWGPFETISWTDGAPGPVAFRTMTTTFGVGVSLHDIKENMAHADVLEIDGSATLELVYF